MPDTETTTTETTTETTEDAGAAAAGAGITTTTEATETTLDAAALARELEQARKDAAKYRGEAKTLRDAQKASEDATKTEDQKRIDRIAELERTVTEREAALRERTSYAAVVDAAARMGAAKPTMIHKLVAGDVEFEDDGTPKNVDQLVRDLLKANPELVSTAGRPGGDAGQGPRGGPGPKLTREMLKGMTPAQINRLPQDQVDEALRQN